MATRPEDQLSIVRRIRAENIAMSAELGRLKGGGGGSTSEPMVPLKEYVDKADEAVESRVNARLDKLATKGTVWGGVATVIGIILAVLAFASDRFDGGLSVQSALEPALAQQRLRDAQQDRKLDEILARLPKRQDREPPR